MIYYVPLWMLPLLAMARAFMFVAKAFIIGCWLTGLVIGWLTRWCWRQAFPPARRSATTEYLGDPRLPRCDECGCYGTHRGTCSQSFMRAGGTLIDPSEQTTVELWPGEKRFTRSGRVPPA